MHATFQPDGRSPKQVNGVTLTSQLKPASDNGQNSGTFPSQAKGRKRERVDHAADPAKRERASKTEDGEFLYKNDSKLKFEIARITDKGGVMDSDGVEKLVQLMAGERKMDLVSRSMLAGVMAATDRVDCLNCFVQFRGLPVLDEWLQDIHKGKIGDGNRLKDSDKIVEEFLLVLLRALDKLPVNLHALQMCNIGRSVNHLRSHKNLEIQKKARSLVDTWKKRVEAEMINIDTRPSKSRLLDAAHGGSRTPSGSDVAMKSSVTQNSSKTTSARSSHVESTTKSFSSPGPVKPASSSPPSSKEGQPLSSVGGTLDVPLTREDRSSSSNQSHNNSQSFSGKEDGKSPTSGSVIVDKISGSSTRSRKVTTFPVSVIGSQKEASSGRSLSAHKTTGLEKFSQPALGTSEKVLEGSINEGSSHKLIVKIPNRVSSPTQGVGDASLEDTTYTSAVLGDKHEQFDSSVKDMSNEHRNNNGLKDVLNVTAEGVGSPAALDEVNSMSTEDSRGLIEDPSKNELISGKLHSSSFGPMDALVESCAKYSEATSSLSPGDDIGMNLLASVATGEMSRSDMASPIDSTEKSTHAVEGVCIGDEAKSKYSPNNYVVGAQRNLCNDTEIEKKHAGLGGCARPEDGASMPIHAAVGFSGDKNCDQFYTPEDISRGHVNSRLDSSSVSLRSNVDTKGDIFYTSLEKAGPTPTLSGKVNDGEINEQHPNKVTSSKINADGISICKSDGINVTMTEKKTDTKLLCHEVKLTVEVTVPNQFSEGGCKKDKKDVHETSNMGTNSLQILSSPSVKSEFSERNTNEKLQQTVCIEVGDKGKIREPDERDVGDFLSKSERQNSDMELDRNATGVFNNMDGTGSTSNDLKNHEVANAAVREISVPVEGNPGSVEHVMQEKAESRGSKPDDAEECGAEVSSSAAAGTSYAKMKFDLNEGFSNDDGRDEEHVSLLSPGATNVRMINPSQLYVNSIYNGHSASITVAAAAKGPFVPPEDLLKTKGELRWKGSAATSAFRPAEPRKVETSFGSTNMPCSDASSSKHGRILLDFDLNVPDESLLEEMASRDSSLAVDSATDILSDRSTLFNATSSMPPVRGFDGLDLDLNKVDEANDNGHCSSSNPSIMHVKAVGGLPSVYARRNFDLNDGPGVDEAGSELLSINQQIKGSMPAQLSAGLRMNGPGLGSYSSWFPPGNTYSTVVIPSMLPDRGEQSFPIYPPNAPQRTFGPSGVNPFTSDIYRGSVLSASPTMSFPSSPFQFPIFPFGTTYPLPSASFPVGGNSYADSASGPRLFAPSQVLVPPVNSQLLGPVVSVTSQFQRPFIVGLPDSFSDGGHDNNRKCGRQGLDLNAGPGIIESEARQEMLPLPSVQHSLSSTQALAEEHGRMYSVSGSILKRREPEGGLENEHFRFKQQ